MKAFNGRAASEEYMSTHSLTFSTPEMTLKKFVLWLGELISDPRTEQQIPRLMLYIEDKPSSITSKEQSNLMPDTDDTFRPSGAVTEMYSGITPSYQKNEAPPIKKNSISKGTMQIDTKFCFECGSKLKVNSKFCRNCGTKQD
jgi:ribosomal protein L40E